MPISQDLFNIVVAVCGALCGWWLRTIWSEIKALQKRDQQQETRVNAIEVLVAGQYVRRDELDRILNSIFEILRRIDDKMDRKVDKP